MDKFNFDANNMRCALQNLPDVAAQESLTPPNLSSIYVPIGHHKALSLDNSVIVGMRGAGKSLWTSVLFSDKHRTYVADQIQNRALAQVVVRVGFGLDQSNLQFPAEGTLKKLVQHFDPFVIWQTVLLRHIYDVLKLDLPFGADWFEGAAWITANSENTDDLMAQGDSCLENSGSQILVIFDALDRLADDWTTVRKLMVGALRLGLQSRSRRAIKLKFFLRQDMEEDNEIWKFPDSSKLRHAKVELSWRTSDLYGFILHSVINNVQYGSLIRTELNSEINVTSDGVYLVPRHIVVNEEMLRPVIEAIAGECMGRSAKRGFTFSWIPTHLADAVGRISPRSFMLAFKRAAEFTNESFPAYMLALHYEAIHQGVSAASTTRVEEITEDYPWIRPLLESVRGITVPCPLHDLTAAWTPECLKNLKKEAGKKLPPRRYETDPYRGGKLDALVDDLVELAVLYRTANGRLNMPDIFRVGFGIKRKGGVKPPRY